MELIFILWILFGVAAASIASSRGHSGLLFFIIGCFIGPFALGFAAVLPINDEQMKACDNCSRKVKKTAKGCKFCNAKLTSA